MNEDHLIIQGWFEAAVLDETTGQLSVLYREANTLEDSVYMTLWDVVMGERTFPQGFLSPTVMAVNTIRTGFGNSPPGPNISGLDLVRADLSFIDNVNGSGLFAYEGRFAAEALLSYRTPRTEGGESPNIRFAAVYTPAGLFATTPLTIDVARDVGINTLLLTYKLGVGPIDRIRGALREGT